MNVLIVSHSAGSPHHGPNLRNYYIAKGLVSRGCKVQVITSSFFHKFKNPEKFDGSFLTKCLEGIDYTWIRTRPYRNRGIGQVVNQLDFVKNCFLHGSAAIRRHPDVVIGSSPHPFVAYYCQHLARHYKIPFLFEVRDLWPLAVRDLGRFPRWHPYVILLALAERFAVRHATAIISVKPGDGEYFQTQYGFPAGRFHYLPNGYLPPDCAEAVLPEAIAGKIPAGKFVVGYIGALSYYYEIDLLLDAAKILKTRDENIVFVLAGDGVLGERIARRVEHEDLRNVVLLGYLENPLVMPLLKQIDLCYLGLKAATANRYGISCNKLYEYMYAKKPVIACYRTLYDPVKEARCGENIVESDAGKLAEGIMRMKQAGSSVLDELGNNAYEYFRNKHDMSIITDDYYKLVLSVAGSKTSGNPVNS